jgi:hypothetical protein
MTSEPIISRRRSKVSEDAADWSERYLGQDPGCGGEPDPHRRVGAPKDEREQREVVQPVAGLRCGQAGEKQADVAHAQRGEEGSDRVQHRGLADVAGDAAAEPVAGSAAAVSG